MFSFYLSVLLQKHICQYFFRQDFKICLTNCIFFKKQFYKNTRLSFAQNLRTMPASAVKKTLEQMKKNKFQV